MKKRLPISLVLIAHNAERTLEQCLQSAAPHVQEIIAIINDCTDNTESILAKYGAKVYEHPWPGFATQKNRALKYAKEPWILSLDTDEVPTAALWGSIEQFLSSSCANSHAAAKCARKTWFMGRWIRHGDWYPDYQTRLFKNTPENHFHGDGDIHETLQHTGQAYLLKGDLLHYSFENIDHLLSKYPRFGNAFLAHKRKIGKRFSAIEAIMRSLWRFFRCYILRLGFLDGYPGFYIAANQAFHTLYRYTRLYEK